MERTILHCDFNGFYASVETLLRPELKDVPMAVCGDPNSRRGIILAKNELAKAYGIQTAETVWSALKKCPELTLVSPHYQKYREYSLKSREIYLRYTDLIEPFGIDEAWLDVTGSRKLFGDGLTIANTLRQVMKEELGLSISVGVSFNKIFAKLGSDYKKPDATTLLLKGNYQEIIYPLPVSRLLFIGPSTQKTLEHLAIYTIGDLADASEKVLTSHLGKSGKILHTYANGLDERPVASYYEKQVPKSIGNGETFSYDLTTQDEIKEKLLPLADRVASRLRQEELKATSLQITIKDINLKSITRQKVLPFPSYLSQELFTEGLEIIENEWPPGKPIRMLTLTGKNLLPAKEDYQQPTLFTTTDDTNHKKKEDIELAMDAIRNKFGHSSIAIGTLSKKNNRYDE